jgi:hypothetical protein
MNDDHQIVPVHIRLRFTRVGENYRVTQARTQVKLGTSEPIGSVEFPRFLYYRIPVRISSGKFRSVPIGFVNFQRVPVEIFRNFSDEIRAGIL